MEKIAIDLNKTKGKTDTDKISTLSKQFEEMWKKTKGVNPNGTK